MLRLLPLLAFALLPAAVAAPVPREVRPDFGVSGLVTRAELEKLTFDTRPYIPRDGRRLPPEPEEKPLAEEDKSRPKNRYDLAVHMPWAKFREGESMPAYFVLRNNRPSVLGLESRIDFSRTVPSLDGGDASFDVRDRATGKSVMGLTSARTNCGRGSLVDVPADGFYCLKADLNRVTGAPLPPGEYEVDWRQGRLAAAPVAFTVEKADRKPAAPSQLPAVHFFHVRHKPTDDERERVGERPARAELVSWRECSLAYAHSDSMSAALAVGQHGVYAPDIRAIPSTDGLVEASVEWKRYREGDRVAVTLRAASPHTKVRFEELPQLFLQVEARETGDRENWGREAYGEGKKRYARGGELLTTPLTIEVHLPKEWRERVVAAEEARVAVLVLAKSVEFPVGAGARLVELQQKPTLERKPAPGEKTAPVWTGIARTEFVAAPPAPQLPVRGR